MESCESKANKSRLRPFQVAALAAVPFVALQVIYLAFGLQVTKLYVLRGLLVCPGVFTCLIACVLELHRRQRLPAGQQRFPWFTLIGAAALPFFFAIGDWVRPLVLKRPSLCYAAQGVEWTTSRGRFILQLSGRGNEQEQRFSGGYLNWTGSGDAGFSSIQLRPIAFQDGYYEPYHAGTRGFLQQHIRKSGLSEPDANRIADEMWSALEQADQGHRLESASGEISAVWSEPNDYIDCVIGGIAWILLVVVLFQVAGQLTLSPDVPVANKPPLT